MQRVLIALAVVVALTSAIFLSVKYAGQRLATTEPSDATSSVGEAPSSGGPGAPGTTTGPVTATPEPPAPYFAFRRLEVQTSGEEPEACLVFTRKLDNTGQTKYEDYLKFDPEVKIALRVTQDRLCIQGLTFAQTYQLELKAGLPAVGGEKLTKSETLPVELRDKPALVRFGNGFVLPRGNADGVPITTVNVAKLDIKVLRVGDRLLSQIQTGLVDQREFYEYERNTIENEQGQLVWEGQLTVPDNRRNDEAITLFPLRRALKDNKPGAYLIIATDAANQSSTEENVDWKPKAAQFVVDTDLGLTSFKGKDGLNVFVRSLKSADDLSGVELALIARNNVELERRKTDSNGRVTFSAAITRGTGGMEPVAIMAYYGSDFSFLDLRRPAFDLTDRGVEGRASPDLIDAYLYTDRGVYRPGETVNVVTLLRDQQAKALGDTQLNYVLSRPDGLEAKKWVVADMQAGGVATPVTLTSTAPRGRWQVAAFVDPKGEPIGRVAFDVQDFVPQKLKVELKPTQKILRPGQPATVDVNGRFLYGAPASGLGGEGTLTITSDSDPFANVAALKGFRFGKVDETFEGTQVTMSVPETDAAGKTQATAAIEELADTTLPLKAVINVAIFEPGGRTTSDQITLPLRTRDTMLGVRPAFQGDSIQELTPANFEVLAVDAEGKVKSVRGVTWELVNEDIDYRWYQVDNDWKYERVVNDRIVDGGTTDLGASAFKISKPLPWGSYRLTVADPASGATTAYRFWSGWGGGADNDRPDRVAVAADKEQYASGDTAKIAINPPTDGKALIVIASNKIHYTKMVDVSASGTTVSVPVSSEWGAGAYALVTHYRPLSSAQTRAPVRSIGVAWIGVDPAPRTLQVALGAPKKVAPNRKLEVPIEVKNQGWGEAVYVTLAAVDEGILQLTDFESPDPNKHYFGKRRLGLDMRDDYGRLIASDRAIVGELRSGGDGVGGRSLAVVPQKTVSLFSGLVALADGGKGKITLDIPDFNGELRLMAVAYTPTKLGRVEQPLTVRDPVVAEVVLPRFMAPGDKLTAALNMHNVEGAAGQYTATVKASGAAGGQTRVTANLGAGERKLLAIPLEAPGTGIGSVALTVEGPNGFKVARAWPIEVREPQLAVSREDTVAIAPGKENRFSKELLASFKPGTAQVAVTVAGGRGFDDVPGLLRWLDRYPYGCIEQTTSRAYPLVYYNDMALLAQVKQDKNIKERVQEAAYKVLDMQTYGGSFGMWSSISGEADPYIGMFATDFLMQAKQAGYVIPEEGIDRALGWARKAAGTEGNGDLARAYGFYLLAKRGTLNPSELRYFADTRMEGMTNAFALGLTAAALTDIGDRARAAPAFAKARDAAINANPATYATDSHYGSLLRDVAGLTAMSAKSGQAGLIPALLTRVAGFDPRLNDTTTQEKAWMLLAAHEVEAAIPPVNVAVSGATVTSSAKGGKVLRFSPSLTQVDQGVTVKNNGQKEVFRIVSAEGIPAAQLPASQNGVTLSKAILTMTGQPASLANVKQNDRFIVQLSGTMSSNRARVMALLDLLPAGFEIEGAVQRKDDGSTIYPFLPVLAAANITEARDDRFVVTFDIGSNYQPTDPKEIAKQRPPTFHFAYIVRATVPGSYTVPAATVEDMYAPDIQARTNMGTMTIASQ